MLFRASGFPRLDIHGGTLTDLIVWSYEYSKLYSLSMTSLTKIGNGGVYIEF